MNAALKASARAVPKATIYRVAGGVAFGSALVSVAVAALIGPHLGTVAVYALVPLLAALFVWAVAGAARLRLVGFLPSEADHFIPPALQPWIRFWLLARFGLLGAMLLLLLGTVVTAVAGGPAKYCIEGLVYVVIVRMLMDLIFGAAFNMGIISRRHSAS